MDGAGDVAASHHAVLTRRQAAESELNPRSIRRLKQLGVLREVGRGTLVVHGAAETFTQQLLIAARAGPPGTVVSFRSAAYLHRIDGFDEAPVEVTVGRGRRVRVADVIVHRVSTPVPAQDVVSINGVPCTSLARTLVDLPHVVGDDVIERALDDFERRGLSLTWLEQTAQRLHRPGQRGTALVLAEVGRRRRRGRVRDSWFERLLEHCSRSPHLPPPTTQHELRDRQGRLVARFDLAFPTVRLAIEAHSRAFHTGAHREAADERRDVRAAMLGWDVHYFGYQDATDRPSQTRRVIEQLVTQRARDLGIDLAPSANWCQKTRTS